MKDRRKDGGMQGEGPDCTVLAADLVLGDNNLAPLGIFRVGDGVVHNAVRGQTQEARAEEKSKMQGQRSRGRMQRREAGNKSIEEQGASAKDRCRRQE